MSDDGNLRPLFRQYLRRGFQWNTIETGGTASGIPDSEFCSGGVARWVEFKQTSGWSVTLRAEQIGWHVARHLRGGVSFVAVRRWHDGGPRRGPAVDELWLFHGRWARELRWEGLRGSSPALGRWGGGPSAWNWDAVRDALLRD